MNGLQAILSLGRFVATTILVDLSARSLIAVLTVPTERGGCPLAKLLTNLKSPRPKRDTHFFLEMITLTHLSLTE